MHSEHKLFAIIIACIAVATPLSSWSNSGSEQAKAAAWGQCVVHHPVTDCDDYAP